MSIVNDLASALSATVTITPLAIEINLSNTPPLPLLNVERAVLNVSIVTARSTSPILLKNNQPNLRMYAGYITHECPLDATQCNIYKELNPSKLKDLLYIL
jgi:hypothetical protein